MTVRVIGIARHGRPRAEMEVLGHVLVNEDGGLDGDFRGQQRQRQVTVLFAEDWKDATQEIGRELPWTTRRANILIEGFKETASAKSVGARLRVGSVVLEVTDETKPCSRMEEQAAGLRAALSPGWRGGLCCKVIAGGAIALGDAAEMIAQAHIGKTRAQTG